MLKTSAFILYSFFTFYGYSQIEEVRRITEELCSPQFHGRGYVNGGDSIAANFIANEFKKAGLKPLTDSYYQSFEFQVNSFPGDVIANWESYNCNVGKDFIVDPSSPSFDGKLRPYYLDVAMILDRTKLDEAVQATLFDKKFNAFALDLDKASGDTLEAIKGIQFELAEYVPIIEITAKKFTWSVARKQIKNPILQMHPEAFRQGEELALKIDAKLINAHKTQNVIGFLPSKRKCKKTIVFTAHYDHLGRLGNNAYFPGANDNASGTAMIISLAKYFNEHASKYNLLFIAFAGEEAGLLGSKYYVEHPAQPLKKIKFLINLDIMGSGEDGITAVNASLFDKEFALLQKINAEQSLLKQVKKRGPAANSDHYWFTEKGVPAFFIYTMGPNNHYHDVFDTYEELSFSEYNDIVTLLSEFIKNL